MEMTERPIRIAICDAGPLIHLDEVGCLDLLCDFPKVIIPQAVWIEVQKHRPGALKRKDLSLIRSTPNHTDSPELEALALGLTLHQGEREGLCLALEIEFALFLTDDTAARLAASSLGIVAHGTIGLLVRAIRREQRTKQEILTILETLPSRSTLHLKPSLLDEVILRVKAD